MLFLKLSNADILFSEKILIYKIYTTNKVLSITKQVLIINKKIFIIVVININSKIFVIYMAI